MKTLCVVVERFQIANKGLVLAPNFGVPSHRAWENFSAQVCVETPDGRRCNVTALFELCHFRITDPHASADKRWRISIILPQASKADVPIGSRVSINKNDSLKVIGEQDASQ